MKKRDIEKALRALGYWQAGGSKHDKWINDQNVTLTVPRHREVKEHLAKAIIKAVEKGARA